jgi:hypothetical protein
MSDGFKGLNVKKTTVKQSKTGADMFIVNLDQETAQALIDKIVELRSNERGVKLTFNTTQKEGKFGQFLSTYFYVDPIEAPGANYGGQGQGQGGGFQRKGTFKPKSQGQSPATKAAAARTLNTEIE